MAQYYSKETAGYSANPITKPASPAYGGRVRRYRASLDLSAVNLTTGTTGNVGTSDSVILARIPTGATFDFGMITSSVTLGSAVVAVGTNATHASNGQYRAAAAFTAVDTPTLFGLAAAQSGAAVSADTLVYLTCATAALPTSGTLVVDLYFNQP
ncbi:hypothetical protein UFOVP68_8 [uncultured Caudovirales phage]|uniref:Uncharacterized protein n=1 Tax=uncultured Caudovirales phage TaxID=2100421 RepID=A0A6J5KYZ6_9CAUD|nr:hypothetical protein UFOVP68_8 [uncultured Caudovirales phage]